MLLDSNDIVKIPFLGKNALESSKRIPQARPGGGDRFIAPVSVPGLPSRNYFIFEEVCVYNIMCLYYTYCIISLPLLTCVLYKLICMYIQPLDTRDLNVYDKKQCREAYATVKQRVEVGYN